MIIITKNTDLKNNALESLFDEEYKGVLKIQFSRYKLKWKKVEKIDWKNCKRNKTIFKNG